MSCNGFPLSLPRSEKPKPMNETRTATTVATDFRGQSDLAAGCDAFFSRLLALATAGPIDEALGESIRTYVLDWLAEHPLTAFDGYSDAVYRRTRLGRSASGWEALVMTWKKGNRTSVHAHPQFAGYHFADGRFLLEIFEPAGPGVARLAQRQEVTAPAAFFAIGEPARFDNHIHRITCLSDTGHSLHVYSDDALRGEVYRAE